MKLVRWTYNNLHIPMMAGNNGDLWCTSKQLCGALGTTELALRLLRKRHADEFDANCVSKSNAILFFKENKVEFGVKYVRGDMALWSEDDMILVAILSRSDMSKQFRKDLRAFIKEHAKKDLLSGYVKKDDYNNLLMEFGRQAVRLENLERLIQPGKAVKLQVVQ